jgi:hypothetical protein
MPASALRSAFLSCLMLALSVSLLAGCSNAHREAKYPTGENREVSANPYEKPVGVFGKGGLMGGSRDESETNSGASGIGVNSFLWRASLDTVAFMPLASADPFGGVILTDWYAPPATPNERFKLNVFILDKQLRSDGVQVKVFKQVQGKGGWKDAAVPGQMSLDLENTILTRARQMRVAQMKGG